MGKANEYMTFMNSVKSLIVSEKKAFSLYEDVADMVASPLIKSLLLHISLDCQKHSTVLRGFSLSLPRKSWTPASLPKSTSEALRSIDDFQVELLNFSEISEEDMPNLCSQLASLEDSLAADYTSLLQLNNLELMLEEINDSGRVSYEVIKTVLLEFLHEEEYHREILATIVGFLAGKDRNEMAKAPEVRFNNPDSWSRVQPMTF